VQEALEPIAEATDPREADENVHLVALGRGEEAEEGKEQHAEGGAAEEEGGAIAAGAPCPGTPLVFHLRSIYQNL
jgi:hypothetical protein